jgi:hypothetical protein
LVAVTELGAPGTVPTVFDADEALAGDEPALLEATTVRVYARPSVSPVTLHEVPVVLHVPLPTAGGTASAVATYCTVPPPLPADTADQLGVSVPVVPFVTPEIAGVPGTVPTYLEPEMADVADGPTALFATTVTV